MYDDFKFSYTCVFTPSCAVLGVSQETKVLHGCNDGRYSHDACWVVERCVSIGVLVVDVFESQDRGKDVGHDIMHGV